MLTLDRHVQATSLLSPFSNLMLPRDEMARGPYGASELEGEIE